MATAMRATSPRTTRTKSNQLPRSRQSIESRLLVNRWNSPVGAQEFDDEGRRFAYLVLMMFSLLVLPGVLVLLYIAFNPNSFQYDITPQVDFSSWHPGKPL